MEYLLLSLVWYRWYLLFVVWYQVKRKAVVLRSFAFLSDSLRDQIFCVPERHARALLKLRDEEDRIKVTDRVVSNNLNVKQTERLIEDVLNKKEEALRKRNKINLLLPILIKK